MPATLSLGSTGDDVKRVQRALARPSLWLYGPFGPIITGVFDASLQAAVERFQQFKGLTVDGIVGPETWGALPVYKEASPTLQLGSTGPDVARLQGTLTGPNLNNTLQYTPYTGPIDGIFGDATDATVRSVQAAANVTVDGVVADDTWFTWMAPGTINQSTLEGECGMLI